MRSQAIPNKECKIKHQNSPPPPAYPNLYSTISLQIIIRQNVTAKMLIIKRHSYLIPRGGRRYQIFETVTATSTYLGWLKPLPLLALLSQNLETATRYSATPLPLPSVYFCGTKRAFHPPLANSKTHKNIILTIPTWSCLTGEPHLTTPYKAAVLVRWPEGICRRLRSRDDPALRCDAMTWENYLYIGSSITDK